MKKIKPSGIALIYDEQDDYAIACCEIISLVLTDRTITLHGIKFSSNGQDWLNRKDNKLKIRYATYKEIDEDIYTDCNCFLHTEDLIGDEMRAVFKIAMVLIEVPEKLKKEYYDDEEH